MVTGDLRIIKDAKVRELVNKGPSYREQNNIDWGLNARICKEAVTKYKVKWSRRLEIRCMRLLIEESSYSSLSMLINVESMSYKLRSILFA